MSSQDDDLIRIALIGKTGSGKSSTANTIFGKEKFMSLLSFDSQTSVMQAERLSRNGRKLLVVDTPGLFDTRKDITNDKILYEIKKSFIELTPGPHAVILVVKIGRYSTEDRETANIFIQCFGEEVLSYLFVVFTGADELRGSDFNQMLRNSKQTELQTLLKHCGGRYIAFNNKNLDSKQVDDLIDMIDQNINRNGGGCYSNATFKQIEAKIEESRMTRQEVQQEVKEGTEYGRNFLNVVTAPIWGPIYLLRMAVKAVF